MPGAPRAARTYEKGVPPMADTFFVSVLFLFQPYRQPPLYVPSLPISFPYPPPAELGTAAIQIMLLPGYLKISVAGQIVRKEPDSAFQGHEPGPPEEAS